jgi:hypothetical protein
MFDYKPPPPDVSRHWLQRSLSRRLAVAPTQRGCAEGGFVLRPIVQARRIEVGAGWPDQGLNFRIKADLSEHGGVAKRTEEVSFKDGPKVDGAQAERWFPNRLKARGWFGERLAT